MKNGKKSQNRSLLPKDQTFLLKALKPTFVSDRLFLVSSKVVRKSEWSKIYKNYANWIICGNDIDFFPLTSVAEKCHFVHFHEKVSINFNFVFLGLYIVQQLHDSSIHHLFHFQFSLQSSVPKW